MKVVFSLALFSVLLWIASCSSALDGYKEAERLEKAGNAWISGQQIPPALLEYRTSWHHGSCFPHPYGTEMLLWSITNYPLIRQIVFFPNVDARVFSNAVTRALVMVGPTRFFADLNAVLREKPELREQDRFKVLRKQAEVKHIVIDSIYITYADMSEQSSKAVLNEIKNEIEGGKPWHDVYTKFMYKNETSYEDTATDGRVIRGKRSRIGNLGDFYLPANGNPMFSFREDYMPKDHLKKLFSAMPGGMVILFDKEDLSRFGNAFEKETGERYVLHRVREVYPGK